MEDTDTIAEDLSARAADAVLAALDEKTKKYVGRMVDDMAIAIACRDEKQARKRIAPDQLALEEADFLAIAYADIMKAAYERLKVIDKGPESMPAFVKRED